MKARTSVIPIGPITSLCLLAACSSTPGSTFATDAGPDGSTAPPGSVVIVDGSAKADTNATTVLTSSDSGIAVGTSTTDCPASAKLVYVTGEGSELYSFYPPTLAFVDIGKLTCLGDDTPSHMTVDRTGTAWVLSENGNELYTASTTNAACTKVANWNANGQFQDFALTFLGTTSATDTTLYMLGTSLFGGGLLGTFDTTTGTVTTVGKPSIKNALGDMTTNGDGTLYFMLDNDEAPLAFYELDPTSGAIDQQYTPGFKAGGDEGLAFWGGSFYAFENSTIYQYDPKAGTTMAMGQAPISVTGAGQSTCVPTVAPPTAK